MSRSPRYSSKTTFLNIDYFGGTHLPLPAPSLDISGQISYSTVFQKINNNKNTIAYPKTFRPGVKRQTVSQQLNRSKFYLAMQLWRSLSDLDKLSWNNKSAGSSLTGCNLFVKSFFPLVHNSNIRFLINYGFGHSYFGHSVFSSPNVPGIDYSLFSTSSSPRATSPAGYNHKKFSLIPYSSPFSISGNFGFSMQPFSFSSFGQPSDVPCQYGYSHQYFCNSPFGSPVPGYYPGA